MSLTAEQFDGLVKKLETLARQHPERYRMRVGFWAVFGLPLHADGDFGAARRDRAARRVIPRGRSGAGEKATLMQRLVNSVQIGDRHRFIILADRQLHSALRKVPHARIYPR